MRDVINTQYAHLVETEFKKQVDFTHKNIVRAHLASYNEYHPLVEQQFFL